MSEVSSRALAASISVSSEPECESYSSASGTSGAEASSPSTGQISPATTTLFISENQRAEVLLTPYARQLTQGGGKPGQGYPAVLTSSAEGSRAKTCLSPDDELALMVPDQDSSLSSHGLPMSLFDLEAGSSLRTSPACSLPPVDEISRSFSARWATSGFTTSPGECWTVVTSECPSAGDVSSSLADVLLETVPDRFFLSPRAAAGIIRRAAKRGRELPRALAEALVALASQHQDDDKRTTRTSSDMPSLHAQENVSQQRTTMLFQPSGPTERAAGDTTSIPSPSPTLFAPKASMPARTELGEERHLRSRDRLEAATMARDDGQRTIPTSSIRRLTPTECERLQSFPDGWTIPNRTVPDTQRWGTP
jgi:C-5 cytosine-specific DNA methylase